MAKSEFQNVKAMYIQAKSDKNPYIPLWEKIARYTALPFNNGSLQNSNSRGNKSKQLDEDMDDPTSAVANKKVAQALAGIMWGTGLNVVRMKPSRYVKQLADETTVEDYYKYASESLLFQMNHHRAGFAGSLMAYTSGISAFGTAGIGAFKNAAYESAGDENCIVYKSFGISNVCISEGVNGLPEYVNIDYTWPVSRIVNEFCFESGSISNLKLGRLPDDIQKSYQSNDLNKEYTIVCSIFPREEYNPKFKGKNGARYKAYYFKEDQNKPFHEEDYKDMPIPMCRGVKVQGEVYGRASATILMSSIRMLNFIMGSSIEAVEKLLNPGLGTFNGALDGDGVLDTSPDSLTVFNPEIAKLGVPVFPIHEVGDISALVNFLVPYLKENITTASDVDVMLDFNNNKDMTATESLQRFSIRGKSLSGMLTQQKNECLIPVTTRSITICDDAGELGVDPSKLDDEKLATIRSKVPQMIIPEAVLQAKAAGKPWYELEFNNELENLTRTEDVDRILKFANMIAVLGAQYPLLVKGVNYYKLLEDAKDALGMQGQVLVGEDEFNKLVAEQIEMQKTAMMMEANKANSETTKNYAGAAAEGK